MNILLLFCILIISALTLYLPNKYLQTFGLKIIVNIFNLLSFILSFKYILINTLNVNANCITYITMLSAFCLLLETEEEKEIKKIVNLNFIVSIFSALILYSMSSYVQTVNDTIGINMTNTFIDNYRILIIYPIITFITLRLLIPLYLKIKNIYNNIFISLVTSYLAIGIFELVTYTYLAYYRILSNQTIIKLLLSTYMIKLILSVIYSIFLTIINKKKVKK